MPRISPKLFPGEAQSITKLRQTLVSLITETIEEIPPEELQASVESDDVLKFWISLRQVGGDHIVLTDVESYAGSELQRAVEEAHGRV